jgi:bifunctional UDP-N-acetylglucosamine pyrophosphorylase/glucosamine-1-phosphate N-acetyltransferase
MLQDFFKDILVPDFLKQRFQQEDWYVLTKDLRDLVAAQIPETQLNSTEETLKTKGKVYIGPNCTIGEYVVIDGPVYIDADVEIGPHVYIRPGSVIAKGCSIGHAAEVKNSVMMEGSKVSNHVFLGDSIIGANARLGGHCETTNRRFDQQPIEFSYRDFKITTDQDKLGLIMGDGSRLGGGVFTAPGTMIGINCFISTMAFVSGYIPSGKFIKVEMETDMIDNRFAKELKPSKLFERV